MAKDIVYWSEEVEVLLIHLLGNLHVVISGEDKTEASKELAVARENGT